jgi:hypothetical protein
MSEQEHGASREELEALAEEMRRVRVEQVVASTVATALELGFLRTGLGPGTEQDLDLAQVELAIETVRGLQPVLERFLPRETALGYRQALSDLQLAYVRAREAAPAPPGAPAAGTERTGERTAPREPVEKPPRPRIWTPGGEV